MVSSLEEPSSVPLPSNGCESTPSLRLSDSPGPSNDLVDCLRALTRGRALTVIGADATTLAHHHRHPVPSLLRLDVGQVRTTEGIIDLILDDLADVALALWPDWPPSKLAPWRRAAERLARAGSRPRLARLAAATQFAALHSVAGSPVLLFPLDPVRRERAAPTVAALEWSCRQGAAAVAALADPPPFEPPWDRVLHGAVTILPAQGEPALARLVPAPTVGPRGSAAERRLRSGIRADATLAALFEDEVTLRLGDLASTPRVDLLWRVGRVVVELDGPEHAREPTYAADRHRDYELLVAGYLVLRLTNAEVELDLARALEKIRRVVALRSGPV